MLVGPSIGHSRQAGFDDRWPCVVAGDRASVRWVHHRSRASDRLFRPQSSAIGGAVVERTRRRDPSFQKNHRRHRGQEQPTVVAVLLSAAPRRLSQERWRSSRRHVPFSVAAPLGSLRRSPRVMRWRPPFIFNWPVFDVDPGQCPGALHLVREQDVWGQGFQASPEASPY